MARNDAATSASALSSTPDGLRAMERELERMRGRNAALRAELERREAIEAGLAEAIALAREDAAAGEPAGGVPGNGHGRLPQGQLGQLLLVAEMQPVTWGELYAAGIARGVVPDESVGARETARSGIRRHIQLGRMAKDGDELTVTDAGHEWAERQLARNGGARE